MVTTNINVLRYKLNVLKCNLKFKNKKVFCNMEFNIKSCMDKLDLWDLKKEVVVFTQEELCVRSVVCEELGKLLGCQDVQLFQLYKIVRL